MFALVGQTAILSGNNSVQKLQEKNQRFYISTERFPQPTAITCYVQSEGYGKLPRTLAEENPLMAIFFKLGWIYQELCSSMDVQAKHRPMLFK